MDAVGKSDSWEHAWHICRFSCFPISQGEGRARDPVMTGALGYLTRPERPGRTRTQGSLQGMSPGEHDTLQGLRVSSGQCGWCNPALGSSCLHSERRMPHVTAQPPGKTQPFLARTLWTLLRHFTPGRGMEQGGGHHLYQDLVTTLLLPKAALACPSPTAPLGYPPWKLPQHVPSQCHNNHHTLRLKPTFAFSYKSKVRSLEF